MLQGTVYCFAFLPPTHPAEEVAHHRELAIMGLFLWSTSFETHCFISQKKLRISQESRRIPSNRNGKMGIFNTPTPPKYYWSFLGSPLVMRLTSSQLSSLVNTLPITKKNKHTVVTEAPRKVHVLLLR